ncbi:MAG: response regulator, partial [Burkholderiales bacterium]|nr:response regulator [Phycisphaerae bacterium]
VLVSDLGMPEMDGLDLIREVRRLGHDAAKLPALALTAFVQQDDEALALAAGFQSHVHKPVNPADLLAAVVSLAGRARD